jgi:hypothetical protein
MKKKIQGLLIIIGCFTFGNILPAVAHAQLTTNETFESIGYYYQVPANYSNRLSASARFRQGSNDWRVAMDPAIILIKNQQRMVAGSIVQLTAGTVYEIELSIIDSSVNNTPIIFSATATTKTEIQFTGTTDTLWVSPNGSGNNYSPLQPGKIENLFTINNIPGVDRNKINTATTIICKEGTYYTGGMSYNLNNSNKYMNNNGVIVPTLLRDKPIKIIGEPGKKIVFDGSDTTIQSVQWQLYDAANKIYGATFPTAASYSTELLIDSVRMFPYPTTYPVGDWKECLNNLRSGDGFYRNGNNFLVKTSDGKSPAGKKLIASKQTSLFSINNTTSSPYVNQAFVFQNLTIQHYSKPIIPAAVWECVLVFFCDWVIHYENIASPEAIKCLNVQDALFDQCRFEYNSFSITMHGNADNTIIQNSVFIDKTGSYSHGDYKNTANYNNFPPGTNAYINDIGKHGRHLELSPIFFSYDDYRSNRVSSKNIVFRNNIVDGFVDGFSGRQIDTLYYYDVDVYNNTFKNNYQGVSALGNNINYRLWNNKIKNCLVGVAFYESPVGPFYIFRNEISNLRDRQNITGTVKLQTYINGLPTIQDKTWGTMFKANATSTLNRQLEINFYHNTVVANDSSAFCLYLWETNWKKIKSANNNFYSKFTNLRFDNVNINKAYNYTGQSDNYFSEKNQIGELIKIHGTSNPSDFKLSDNLEETTNYLRLFSNDTDTASLYVRGTVANPLFLDDTLRNYTLSGNSTLINAGLIIPNISDLPGINYTGTLPDIGAYEYNPLLVYTFIGNGNWNIASNWKDNRIPPAVIQNNEQIIINPVAGGQCILNVVQQVKNDSQIKVLANKNFKILGNIVISR